MANVNLGMGWCEHNKSENSSNLWVFKGNLGKNGRSELKLNVSQQSSLRNEK